MKRSNFMRWARNIRCGVFAAILAISAIGEVNASEAEKYRKAAEQGDAEAQLNLGVCYATGDGVRKDFQEAVKWFRKAAEQGHAWAQFALGDAYDNGDGVAKNPSEAVKWYRKAAEQGNEMAQSDLGNAYMTGQGVEKDLSEAVKWWRKAAEQGSANAQFNLGLAYANGDGVAKDPSEAVKWYRKAAEQGDAGAQVKLGACYVTGDGVQKDFQEAVKWYRKAAEQGDAEAQFTLGLAYADGDGVAKDPSEAVKWYRLAAKQGNEDAKKALAKLHAVRSGNASVVRQRGPSAKGVSDGGQTSAPPDLSSEEKIRIIGKIAAEKIAEAKGADVLNAVLEAVSERFVLDAEEETPEAMAVIEQIGQQVRKKYPVSDYELTLKYTPMAESLYPVYKTGENVEAVYELNGKSFVVTGPYYRSNALYVWVGSKKIRRSQLLQDIAPRFDEKLAAARREQYIRERIAEYHRPMEIYERQLLRERNDELERYRKKIKFNGRWQAGRTVVEQKYKEALVVYQKTEQVKGILEYCSQEQIDPERLKKEFGVDLFYPELLSLLRTKYRGIPGLERLVNVVNGYQQVVARRIINNGLQLANGAKTYEKAIDILKKTIESCPKHTPELATVKQSLQTLESQYVNLLVEKAKKSNTYDEALEYLDKALACDYAPNLAPARALYTEYKILLDNQRQAERRAKQEQYQSRGRTCPTCHGSGIISQAGYNRVGGTGIFQRTSSAVQCYSCSGTGRIDN